MPPRVLIWMENRIKGGGMMVRFRQVGFRVSVSTQWGWKTGSCMCYFHNDSVANSFVGA